MTPTSTAAPSPHAVRPRRRPPAWLGWLIVAGYMVLLTSMRAANPTERDQYWGARAGIENLSGAPLARPDTWSWSQPGGTWFQNSPAWYNLLGWASQQLGWWGFYVTTAASVGALLFVAWRLAAALGARPLPGLFGLLVALIPANLMLNPRATVVVQVALLAAVWFGWRMGPRMARWPLAAAAATVALVGFAGSAVGNQVHLSFTVMAAAVAVMWAVQWVTVAGTSWRWRAAMTVAGTAGLAAGVLTTPYGLAQTLAQSKRTQELCAGLISEWMPLWQLHPVWSARAVVVFAAALAGAWWLARRWRAGWHTDRFRIAAPLLAVGVPAALAGVGMMRFLGVAVLTLLPLYPWLSTAVVDRAHRMVARARHGAPGERWALYTSGHLWTLVLGVALVPLLAVGTLSSITGARPPETDLAERLPAGCRLFSDTGTSGVAVLARPDVTVWMDGRADYFGRDQLRQIMAVMRGDEPVPAGATCIILDEQDASWAPAVERLGQDQAWRRVDEANGYSLWLPQA